MPISSSLVTFSLLAGNVEMILLNNSFIKIWFSLFLFSNSLFVSAQDNAEREHLTAMVRQLELMQQMTTKQAELYPANRSRYYFDYQRLNADLQRIQNGIDDYLTPKRAQPRDPLELNGHYQQLNSGVTDE